MAIQQLYDSLAPSVFYSLIVGVAFLIGLGLGWCLWWWKARQLRQTRELSSAADAEVDELRQANRELSVRVQHAEQANQGIGRAAQHQQEGLHSGGSIAWMPLDESAALQPLPFSSKDSPETDWSSGEGIQPELAEEPQRLGSKNLPHVASLSDEQRQAFDASWFANSFLSNRNTLEPPPHATAPAAPPEPNPLLKKTSRRVGRRIAGFSSGTGRPVSGFPAQDGYTTQRLSDLVADDPNQIPVFATDVPRVKDDLTLLDGIDPIKAEELHRMGIHNFDQLHDLSEDDRHRLKAWFRRQGWYLDMDQWRIASEGNTLNPTLEDIQGKAFEVFQYRDREGRHGAENTDWEQAEWSLRGNPIFDYGVPHHVDYFVETVDGITPAACDELYRMGLYNLQEIQSLDLDSRRLLTRWFAGPRFKVDLTAAFGWLSSLETVPQDKDFGFVFAARPEQIDDLSDINGIGPATERDLNRIGIYHFNQVAHWSRSNVEAICDTLNLGDRIEKDMWVVQAQRLAGHTS